VNTNADTEAPARSVDEAIAALLRAARPIEDTELLATADVLGRVLAIDVQADSDLPRFDNSAVDGYALAAADVPFALADGVPVSGRYPAGAPGGLLEPRHAARVFTGSCLPAGTDCVVPQELCEWNGNRLRLLRPPRVGENVRRRGEDVRQGHLALLRGSQLRPQDLAIAAAVGRAELVVYRRLRVGILCTGNELVKPGQAAVEGRIFDANTALLTGLLQTQGCSLSAVRHAADDLDATSAMLEGLAAASDVIITAGGASVGEEDYLRRAIDRCGRIEFWRVAIKPGKPFAFGRIAWVPLLGLPGNPTSALVTFCVLVRPFLRRLRGMDEVLPAPISLPAGFDRPAGVRREYLRVHLEAAADEPVLVLSGSQSSGVLSAAVRAQGLAVVLEGRAVRAGDRLDYYSFDQLLS